MKIAKKLLKHEAVRLPIGCIAAFGGGYLLSVGTVCGIASPLAAALAGVCAPLYAFCILFGSLLAYSLERAPTGMAYLLMCLVIIACMRIVFYEVRRPHMLAILTAVSCTAAGLVTDLCFAESSGFLPLYIMEALLIGTAAFFMSDAWCAFRRQDKICLDAGKSFTFAIAYLLGVTALCGMNLEFCNIGRVAGIVITLLAAKHFGQSGGTLLGALTACGAVLCSVPLGMPLLFLPVTAMLIGFLNKMPNALFIPLFFFMQALTSAVLDSSAELARILVELLLACCIYALCSHAPLYRILTFHTPKIGSGQYIMQREQFLSRSIGGLREEAAAVVRHLRPESSSNAVRIARTKLCTGCKNEAFCWTQRKEKTEDAFRQLLHYPCANPGPEAMAGCIRRGKMTDCFRECGQRAALEQSKSVYLTQSRNVMFEYLRLMEDMAADAAKQRDLQLCSHETKGLQEILRQCKCEFRSCFVHRLKCGRYAAEIYTKSELPAQGSVQALLSDLLHTQMCAVSVQQNGNDMRYCYYQKPAFQLNHSVYSVHAPGYARCGDTADAFTDAEGNQYLILSDGMGSGSAAALVSQLAVRGFVRLVSGGMPPETAIRFANTMLLSETNTESFATLDVLRLNADSGQLQLYKSGASSTLLRHRGQVHRIASPSFPIGIVPQAEPFMKTFSALPDDKIIMISDGINEAEYPFIKELLMQNISVAEIGTLICEKAEVFQAGNAVDDMTVIAAEIQYTASAALQKMQEENAAV